MKKNLLKFLLSISILLTLSYHHSNPPQFDANKILENSILKEKDFTPNVEAITNTKKDLSAYLIQDHSTNLVFINFGFEKMGKAYEPKKGLSLLTKSTLLDGTTTLDRKSFRNLLKEKGIKISINQTADTFDFSFSYIKENELTAWDTLKTVLYSPLLDENDISLTKSQLKNLKIREDEYPTNKLKNLIKEQLYTNHPYGAPTYPSNEELDSLTPKDIREYLKNYMTKDTLTVGLSGNITPQETASFLDYVFNDLSPTSPNQKLLQLTHTHQDQLYTTPLPYSNQSFVAHITNGINRSSKDFYPFYIADYIFGGSGLNSRLNKQIRENEGLTYGISSFLTENDASALWTISYSSAPNNVNKIEEIIKTEYQNFLSRGITHKELEQAKASLLTSFNLRFSSLSSLSYQLQLIKRENLGQDFFQKRQSYIKSITLPDVNRVIKQKFSPSKTIFMATGK